ncbi:MAG TPA: type II toxin-antitoxin system VapB family antitoxin [Rhizomicrobium sp.]|jgi:antitoxin VapB|nr:type II toxin-antitoxin system VapB family antitoxin [Rhizomicrobium sp.]
MGINIKSESAEAIVRELAARTGEGLTEAIEIAARERLARLEAAPRQTLENFLEAIRPLQDAIARERGASGDQRTARELIEELYDEHGLPK